MRDTLEDAGYLTLLAGDGAEALHVVDGYERRIDLLITDAVMPRMTGSAAAYAIKAARPAIKVLYMSGYPDHSAVRQKLRQSGAPFLSKPFGSIVSTDDLRFEDGAVAAAHERHREL